MHAKSFPTTHTSTLFGSGRFLVWRQTRAPAALGRTRLRRFQFAVVAALVTVTTALVGTEIFTWQPRSGEARSEASHPTATLFASVNPDAQATSCLPAGSHLRREVESRFASLPAPGGGLSANSPDAAPAIDLTPTLLRYMPAGTRLESAEAILRCAGFDVSIDARAANSAPQETVATIERAIPATGAFMRAHVTLRSRAIDENRELDTVVASLSKHPV